MEFTMEYEAKVSEAIRIFNECSPELQAFILGRIGFEGDVDEDSLRAFFSQLEDTGRLAFTIDDMVSNLELES